MSRSGSELQAVLVIAQRDVIKLMRDRVRLAVSLAFPILIIVGLSGVIQPTLSQLHGLSALPVLFTGVLAATLFQSAAGGMMSLIQDRETDFARELFIAPVSRVALVSGKVAGEAGVALVQGVGIVAFALAIGLRPSAGQLVALIPAAALACLMGAAFGLVTLALLPNQQAALQVLPFLVLPQYFFAGVITPVSSLPGYLAAISWFMPMRYAVDLTRAAYYAGHAGFAGAVAAPPILDALVALALMGVLLLLGAALFDRRERNR